MAEDCYFFINWDDETPDEERKVSFICMECAAKEQLRNGCFHEGSEVGYGPWDYKCCRCDKFISKAEESECYEAETSDQNPRGEILSGEMDN